MEYLVSLPDGSKVGPVDEGVLKAWAQEGRVTPETMLERFSDGVRQPAAQVMALAFPPVAAASTAPGTAPSRPAIFKDDAVPQRLPPAAAPTGNPWEDTGPVYPGAAAGTPDQLLGRFNWGAFCWHWIWGLTHKAFLPLVLLPYSAASLWVLFVERGPIKHLGPPETQFVLLAVLSLPFRIYFGIKGYEWAWRSDRYADPDDCEEVQRRWMMAGVAVVVIIIAILYLAYRDIWFR